MAQEEDVGAQLERAGWRQGSFVPFPTATGTGGAGRDPLFPTLGVIATHSCDLVKEERLEPDVEVLRLDLADPSEVRDWRRGHPRKFVVDQTQRIVADVTQKATIAKQRLVTVSHFGGLSLENLQRFQQWLAGRYARPSLEKELAKAVAAPALRYFRKAAKSDNLSLRLAERKVESVRFAVVGEGDPLEIDLFVLVQADAATDEEHVAVQALIGGLAKALAPGVRINEAYVRPRSSMTIDVWLDSIPLDADALTYAPEGEITGPEPRHFGA